MASSKLLFAAVVFLAFLGPITAAVASPGIFGMFSWGLDQFTEGKSKSTVVSAKSDGGNARNESSRCACRGSWCSCCVDLSLVGYIDIGGPGCVDMRYISQEEGIKLNLTYGDSLLHGAQVKAGNPVPICMDLLSDLAQVCATMKQFRKEGDGLRGCASLEPTLLGEVQEEYPLGCFSMGDNGIIVEAENETLTESSQEEEEEGTTETGITVKPPVNEEALIAAVNESAEEGIAWFSSLLGLSFGGNQKNSSVSSFPLSSSSSLSFQSTTKPPLIGSSTNPTVPEVESSSASSQTGPVIP